MIEDDFYGNVDFNVLPNSDPMSKYVTENELNAFFQFSCVNSINILQINCRSIKKNYNSITNLLSTLDAPLSAIAVSETRLSASLHDVYSIPSYNFFAKSQHG